MSSQANMKSPRFSDGCHVQIAASVDVALILLTVIAIDARCCVLCVVLCVVCCVLCVPAGKQAGAGVRVAL